MDKLVEEYERVMKLRVRVSFDGCPECRLCEYVEKFESMDVLEAFLKDHLELVHGATNIKRVGENAERVQGGPARLERQGDVHQVGYFPRWASPMRNHVDGPGPVPAGMGVGVQSGRSAGNRLGDRGLNSRVRGYVLGRYHWSGTN